MKKLLSLISILLFGVGIIVSVNFVYADTTTLVQPSQPGINLEQGNISAIPTSALSPDNNLFNEYQITNDSLNRQISLLEFIATIFGIFIAALLGFFAIRQFSIDREISRYKDNLKENNENFNSAYATKQSEMNDAVAGIQNVHAQMKGIFTELEKTTSQTPQIKTDIEKVKSQIDDLEKKASYELGRLSGVGASGPSYRTGSLYTGAVDYENLTVLTRRPNAGLADSIINGIYSDPNSGLTQAVVSPLQFKVQDIIGSADKVSQPLGGYTVVKGEQDVKTGIQVVKEKREVDSHSERKDTHSHGTK